MLRFAMKFVACAIGSVSVAGFQSEARAQNGRDEIIVSGRCSFSCLNGRLRIYGVNGGGGGGTSDCGSLGGPFPQLLWEPPVPNATQSCTIETNQPPPGPPPAPTPGDMSVTMGQNYEIDADGDGNIDVFLEAPVMVVGLDGNVNGIPDLWEGLMINGIARQAP